MARALWLALSKPRGPVVLEVPEDMWRRPVDADPRDALKGLAVVPARPGRGDVEEILGYMVRAEKPAVLVRGEASLPGVGQLFSELARRHGAYVMALVMLGVRAMRTILGVLGGLVLGRLSPR